GEHRDRESATGDLLREMTREPNSHTTANAVAAEVSRLIPTSGASFCVFGDRMRHQTTDRKHDQRSGNLRNKNNCHQNGDGVLMERKKRKNQQRRRGRAKSQQIPAARGQSQVRHRSPEKSPEICRHMATIDAASAPKIRPASERMAR